MRDFLAAVLIFALSMAIMFGLGYTLGRVDGWSMDDCPALTVAVADRPDSLEIQTAEATPDGVQLTEAGCFMYGSMLATVNQQRGTGVRREYFLGMISDWEREAAAGRRALVPGMADFLRAMIAAVYSWPAGFSEIPYAAVRNRAIEDCRSRGGRSWLLLRGV